MELREIWIAYCEDKVAPNAPPIAISPDLLIERLWDFNVLFTQRHDIIRATPYSTDFDEEADGALAMLALHDRVAWDGLSAGAWRVLHERLAYTYVVAMANKAAGERVISHLPKGLSREQQSRALLLQFLLGGARAIDRRLLPQSPDGTAPLFPASAPVRPQ